LEPLVDEGAPALVDHLLLELELDAAARRVLRPGVELGEASERLLRLRERLRRGQLDHEIGLPRLPGDLGVDAPLLERRPEVPHDPVEDIVDPLVEVDAEDQVDPALEVQAQVDRLPTLATPVAG